MADAICQRFLNRDALEAAGFPVGGFAWAETTGDGDITAHLQLCVPGDFDPPGEPIPWRFRVFPVYREGGPVPARTAWSWDGNEDTPTIRPSLGCYGRLREDGYIWHGFLTAGVLRSV